MNEQDFHKRVADGIPQIKRGKVWCKRCGRSEQVNGAQALCHGWPECCGETMTIDSPTEQKRLAKRG